jgi:SAM-dependent methyltransferase
VSIFRWTAPVFKRVSRKRWSDEDFRQMAHWLRPYVPPGGLLADLGGGTGELGAGLAFELGAQAVIVDATPQMLRRVDAVPWVSVRLATAETLPFPDGYFAALVCCDAFHHFRDQDAVVREIARVLRPHGGVLILDLDPRGSERIVSVLERLVGEPAGFRTPAGMELLMREHGIDGRSQRQRGSGYAFVGTLLAPDQPGVLSNANTNRPL